MLRNDIFSVVFVTVFLVAYCILLQFSATFILAEMILVFSPLMICWMVFTVLKYGKYEGPELGDDEFGYLDKKKEELGVF